MLVINDAKFGLLHEFGYTLPSEITAFAKIIKNLELKFVDFCSMDYAILTRGGVAKRSLDADLMLNDIPRVYCAGEMPDWIAPTGADVGRAFAKYFSLTGSS